MFVSFDHWTGNRAVASMGTNAGSTDIPFQKWRHFKEAYAPELVARAIRESEIPVESCVDPFGGSGTTALACQFLGVRPVTAEVNPYLADLIEAKLTRYDVGALVDSLGRVLRGASVRDDRVEAFVAALPATFVEPGVGGRWVFDRAIAMRLVALALAIDGLDDEAACRLLKVLLGGIMLSVSNVVVNGKGRRYRRGWEARRRSPAAVDAAFADAAVAAVAEVDRFSRRAEPSYTLIRGDCRGRIAGEGGYSLSAFSPPYPNSFDYTDVYNVELWMLGYLRSSDDNRALRRSTLSSHVQIHRDYGDAPAASPRLAATMESLRRVRGSLWNRRIPDMVGGYFADMAAVMAEVGGALSPGGAMWMVVGDSRYADVPVATAAILSEIVPSLGLELDRVEPLRDMRASAQQGGQPELAESLVVARRP